MLLMRRMTGSLKIASVAGFAFSLLSPSTILIPWTRNDVHGWLGPWRLCVLAAYGDAPHMFAFALIPFAILALDSALRSLRAGRWFLAAILLASISTTNWLGTLALACMVFAYLLATTAKLADLSRWGWSALIALTGYAMASPWIPPSTIALVRANGQLADGDYRSDMEAFPQRALILGIIYIIVKIWLHRRKTLPAIQFAAFAMILPGGIPLLGEWGKVALFPIPHRYHWELDFAVIFLVSLAVARLFRNIPPWAKYAGFLILGVAALWQFRSYRNYASALIRPIDISTTVEHRIALWLRDNHPHDRVFAIGTVSYWLNAFSDIQQVAGGFEHATPNEGNRQAVERITNGDGPEAIKWLTAVGADLIVVGGPNSRAPFRRIQRPAKFEMIAERVWSEGDDTIYRIPRRVRSLAHVVKPTDLVAGVNGGIERYVAALRDPTAPIAMLQWRHSNVALISTEMLPMHLLSVQVNFNPGWRATVEGRTIEIEPDGLGFMAIDPKCAGRCTVTLAYVGGREFWLTRASSWITILCLTFLAFRNLVRRRRQRVVTDSAFD